VGTENRSLLFNIETKELDDIKIIKLLKQRNFSLNFFCNDKIIKKKRMSKQMLLEAGYKFNDFVELSADNLLKLYIDRDYVIEILKQLYKNNRLILENLLKLKFTIPELIKIGFNPLILYATHNNDNDLVSHYLNLERPSKEVIDYLLSLLMKKSNGTFETLLRKIISVSNLNKILKIINKSSYYSRHILWFSNEHIIQSYTPEDQQKLKDEKPLESKDETIRFRYVGTATEFKRAGFTPAELKDEFTPAELREAGFREVELTEAGFREVELREAGF
jgi:hypothetical protein